MSFPGWGGRRQPIALALWVRAGGYRQKLVGSIRGGDVIEDPNRWAKNPGSRWRRVVEVERFFLGVWGAGCEVNIVHQTLRGCPHWYRFHKETDSSQSYLKQSIGEGRRQSFSWVQAAYGASERRDCWSRLRRKVEALFGNWVSESCQGCCSITQPFCYQSSLERLATGTNDVVHAFWAGFDSCFRGVGDQYSLECWGTWRWRTVVTGWKSY